MNARQLPRQVPRSDYVQAERCRTGEAMTIVELRRELDVRDLLDTFTAIARRHHVTLEELMSSKRQFGKAICLARRAAWVLLREAGWSYTTIAKLWGIDHSSVMHGVRKAKSAQVIGPDLLVGVPDMERQPRHGERRSGSAGSHRGEGEEDGMKTVQEWIDAWGELPFADPTHDTIGARIYDQQVEQMVRAIQADAIEACALRSVELGGVGACESLAHELRKLKPEAT